LDTPSVIEGFHLSPQQKRLWSLQQGGTGHVAQCSIALEGALNERVLEEALRQVVARAEILRTAFRRLPALQLPVQSVAESAAPEWRTLDLGGGGVESLEAAAQELALEDARRPFDLERGPTLRALLLRLAAGSHLLTLTLPSLCADSGTLKNLFEELSRRYAARLGGESPREEEEEESPTYAQISEWQNELLEGEDAAEGERFWRGYDLASLSLQTLPYAAGARAAASFSALPLRLAPESAAQLDLLPERYGATAADWLRACWQVLLWRLTRREELVIGDLADGREFELLEGALGPLAKPLPVRVRLSGGESFTEALAQAAESARAAREWQEHFVWRSEGIEEATGAEASSPRYLPFGFEFERWPAARVSGGVRFSVESLRADADRHDVKLCCASAEGVLVARLYYDSSRFELADIIRLGEEFQTLLAATLARPESAVAELDLLGEAERNQLLVAWNDAADPAPQVEKCLHEQFSAQAALTPEREAVVFGDERLTFAELDARSDALARELRDAGVGPEVCVGLCVERSVEMFVGLLGILKAGGAYLPLDHTHPPERLRFMLEDARSPLVVTQARLSDALAESGARVVCVDGAESTAAAEAVSLAGPRATPDNLAYVIYTSGSTGRPKGVMVQHRSVMNLASALARAIYAGEAEQLRVGLNAPLVFDGSVKQIVQLLAGHTLYVVPEELRLDPPGLLRFVDGNRLDALDVTPAQLKLLLDAGLTAASRRAPRLMLVGGEAIDAQTWEALAAQTSPRFFNVYGPTECTVDATACEVRARPSRPTIGRPLANVRAYVLEEGMRPAPVGVAGELYVGGRGVARGYLGRAALTAERFVPDPFAGETGARLYRTGDLARFLSDGHLEFLGRADEQVKFHGFRIELGEIEAALASHPSVLEAAAAVREGGPGGARLVGYVTPRGGGSKPDARELRAWLRRTLPEYMTPSAFVILERLPLTRRGKLDRAALPEPGAGGRDSGANYVAPRNEIERKIATVWQEVLRVERVGVRDNFFDLGGHSLLMVQVHNRLREEFETEFSVVELFKNPTVGALTKLFSGEGAGAAHVGAALGRAERRKQSARRRRHTNVGKNGSGE
jgi:amino acid adenylation domain-containing protein